VRPLLPFARNELFVGREDQLKSLEQSLLPNEPFETHRRRTIHGLGGCGKSALALEFAYRALVRLPQLRVFWVPALTQESFLHAYQEIAIRLSIPGIHVKDVDMKKLVVDALSAPSIGNWLMIVDNVDDSEVLFGTDNNLKSARFIDWLPHSNHGIILFTTRNRGVAEQLTPGLVLDMKEMTPSEARQMVTCRITKKELLDDDITINKLVRLLEHLPLAIVSATAFISNKEVTVTEYVSQFQETDWMTKLFSDHFVDSSRYVESDSTIARTWHISFEHIRKQDPLAAEYLSFMACIDRINIPRSVLPPGTWLQQTSALGTLKSYAFITEQQREKKGLDTERLFDMHRLVHMASVSWLDAHCERKTWAGTVSDRLIELIPRNGNERSEVWRNYLSHAIYVVDHEVEMEDALKAAILNRVGRCQSRLGQCAAAKMTFSRTLELRKKCLGKQDDRTLATMDELGVALSDLGQYPEAEDMHKQALVGRRERLGFDHPHTLGTMSNLASTLMEQHRFAEAESMYKDAIELQVKVCGSGHLDTLTSMSNLALVLSYQRKLEESESLNWVALEGKTKLLGREHPSTTATMGNLALVLNSQGKKAEALALTKEVHEHKEKALGRDHPQTLISVNNLISMLDSDQEAEPMLRDLLKRRSEVLGPRHPHTLAEMENLALCLDRQGKDEAEAVAREVLIMRQDVHGPDHLNTISSVWSLALILGHDYQFAESHKLFERAYAGLCAANGENDNTTRNCRHDWDKMLAEQAASRNMPEKLVARVARIRLGGWMPFARYND
jgi:tetratricopeptide (TPR) repeat protein